MIKKVMSSVGRKLFDEVDIPLESKIVSEDPVNKIGERESSWTGEINGIDPFPSGKMSGNGSSIIHSNGISISSWQGKFTTHNREVITFKGRDVNKNGKFILLRTYFTDSLKSVMDKWPGLFGKWRIRFSRKSV